MSAPLVVATAAGRVRGHREAGLTAWRGVPYARPPVGELRLRAPEPPEPWPGVLDTTRDGPLAPQPRLGRLAGAGLSTPISEDCLTLTVLRRTAGDEPKPVMVFIHGGAYGIGGTTAAVYRGEALAARADVVVVAMNYRLGALGWIDFRDAVPAGRRVDANCGLRDQLLALRWVRDNIAAFGGDPDQVTLFGESAGATSVLTLLASPAARGLFARAIAESPAIGAVHSAVRSRGWGRELVDLLPGGAAALLDGPTGPIVRTTTALDLAVSDRLPAARLLGPVVDGDLVPEPPVSALGAGRGHPVPLIIGTNADEGSIFQLMPALRANAVRMDRMFEATVPAARDAVLAAYPGSRRPRRLAGFVTDLIFQLPAAAVARGHSGVAPTWMYRYDFTPPALRLTGLGALHGAELDRVFARQRGSTVRLAQLLGGRADARRITRRLSGAWASFARTGTPGPDWPRFTAPEGRTLVVDARDRIEEDPGAASRAAWAGWRPYD